MLQLHDATNPIHKNILVMIQNSTNFRQWNINNCLKLFSEKHTPSQFFHSDYSWKVSPNISMDLNKLSIWFGLSEGTHFIDILSWNDNHKKFIRARCGFPKGKGLLFNTIHAGSASDYEERYNQKNNILNFKSSRYFAEVETKKKETKIQTVDSVVIICMRK